MRSILVLPLLIIVAACNPVPPLTNVEKAKFVYELIEDAKTCDIYRQRLSVPGIESNAIDTIYQEARAYCIKRDV